MITAIQMALVALLILISATPVLAKIDPSQNIAIVARMKKDFQGRVALKCWLRPCSIRADFDGDGKPDKAALVVDTSRQNKKGIIIAQGTGKSVLMGPGNPLGEWGDDLSEVSAWKVTRHGKTDALALTKDSAQGLIFYADGQFQFKLLP